MGHDIKIGPGLRVVDGEHLYSGRGYCDICGDGEIAPHFMNYWDPDAGWRYGVLCRSCAEAAAARGPRSEDHAYADWIREQWGLPPLG